MNLRNSKNRLVLLITLFCLLALPIQAITVEGNVVAAQPDRVTVEAAGASGVRPGDSVRFVTQVAGRTLDAGLGMVVRVEGSSIQAKIESGRVNMGMLAIIELARFVHECDTLASLADDIFAVSDGVRIEDLDALTAIKICRDATKEHPKEARFHAQLAYAYLAAEQPGRAILSFERALKIEPGYPAALHNLATIYRFGPEELQNHTEARKRFNAAAELEYLAAMPILGEMCRDGLGGEPDYAAAAKWFEIAANEDDPYSQNAFGECYENGWGVDKDVAMALLWYRSASEQGFSAAMRNLGRAFKDGVGVKQDPEKGLVWFEKAAEAGDQEAQYEIGIIYLKGLIVRQNVEQGIKWLEQSAEQDFAKSLATLGQMHLDGQGFKRNYDLAAHYFGRGAEAGHTSSQYNYAVLLEKGSGVERDKELASDYYRKAARKNHRPSQERLTKLKLEW